MEIIEYSSYSTLSANNSIHAGSNFPASVRQVLAIAERDGLKAGIQCKLYSSSIGNKAVQEAFAGKSYHSLDATIVMSNAPFTKSAQNLAESTGVILASHYDIPGLSAKIEREFPARISNDAH